MKVINLNIIQSPIDYAIVQCISADCAMGITAKGVEIPCLALSLRKKYPTMVGYCKASGPMVGDVLLYRDEDGDGRYIFNLVTKAKYYDKPIYRTMSIVLNELYRQCFEFGIFKLAVPKLGSGLDKLDWDHVSCMIDWKFYECEFDVVLYDLKREKSVINKTTLVNRHHNVPYDVYIGRGTIWGNPFSRIGGPMDIFKTETREESIDKYREWVVKQPQIMSRLHELKGKTLCCSCSPNPCHGDVLIELCESL